MNLFDLVSNSHEITKKLCVHAKKKYVYYNQPT